MNCIVCGDEFEVTTNQVSCSEKCKKIRKDSTYKLWVERKKGQHVEVDIVTNSPVQNSFLSRGL